MMLVDDVWATVGSCNLHPFSLAGHTEMNASIWDAALARDLRCRLFAQHLGIDTASLDDRAALRQVPGHRPRQPARMESRAPDWQGLAFALSPETYARKSGVKPDLT